MLIYVAKSRRSSYAIHLCIVPVITLIDICMIIIYVYFHKHYHHQDIVHRGIYMLIDQK